MAQGGPELQHIVGGTDQRPFPLDLPHPPRQALAKAASLLDLPKDRLHDGLPLGVPGAASIGPPRPPHPVCHRQPSWRPAARGGECRSPMRLPIWRHQQFTAQDRNRLAIRFAEIAGIQAGHPQHLPGLGQHRRHQRLGLPQADDRLCRDPPLLEA